MGSALAQTDEIQVYDAAIAAPGRFNLTLHNNFTPIGRDTLPPGGIIPDKSLNGVPEWAYGVTDWFEAGLYMPVYSISRGRVVCPLTASNCEPSFCLATCRRRSFFLRDEFRQ